MLITRFHFEFHGQDFDWWDVDTESGQVVGCGPLQDWFWADGTTFVNLGGPLAVGDRINFTRDLARTAAEGSSDRFLKYPIERIDPNPHRRAAPLLREG